MSNANQQVQKAATTEAVKSVKCTSASPEPASASNSPDRPVLHHWPVLPHRLAVQEAILRTG